MFSTIPIYIILAGISWMELEYRGYVAPMNPLQRYGLSLLTGVQVFASVEYLVAVWPKVQRILQVGWREAEQPPVPASMEEGEK